MSAIHVHTCVKSRLEKTDLNRPDMSTSTLLQGLNDKLIRFERIPMQQ